MKIVKRYFLLLVLVFFGLGISYSFAGQLTYNTPTVNLKVFNGNASYGTYGGYFSKNGLKAYISGYNISGSPLCGIVEEWTCATAFNEGTCIETTIKSQCNGIRWYINAIHPTGNSLYLGVSGNYSVQQYNLTTAYSISNIVLQSYNYLKTDSPRIGNATKGVFNNGGMEYYSYGGTNIHYKYLCSTAYRIDTCVYNSTITSLPEEIDLVCSTRNMILPWYDTYKHKNGTINTLSSDNPWFVAFTNSGQTQTTIAFYDGQSTGFTGSIEYPTQSPLAFYNTVLSTKKPYLYLTNNSGINYFNLSGSLDLGKFQLYNCEADYTQHTELITNANTTVGQDNNYYYTGTGYILAKSYKGLCLEFANKWFDYQVVDSYEFGLQTLKSQSTTICKDNVTGNYYNGSGTLLCSGSGCTAFEGTGTIDLKQELFQGTLYKAGTGGIKIDFTFGTPYTFINENQCIVFGTGNVFNYISKDSGIIFTITKDYKAFNDWHFTVFGADLGISLSNILNSIVYGGISLIFGFLNFIIGLIISPLTAGFLIFTEGQKYCYLNQLVTVPTRLTQTGITHTTINGITNLDIFLLCIIGMYIISLIFNKK